jgi:hypothetical protein
MFTSAECRERAEQKLKLAACDIRHRRRLTRAAHAWLILADREELLEAAPNIPRNRYSVAMGWKADFEQAASKMLDLLVRAFRIRWNR